MKNPTIQQYQDQIKSERAFNLPIQGAFAAKKFFTQKIEQLQNS